MRLTVTKLALVPVVLFLALHAGIRAFPLAFAYEQEVLIMAKMALAREAGPAPVLVLGDSRLTYGVKPLELAPGALSLAVPGASTIEPYFQLRAWLAARPAPKLVIYGVSPNFFEHAESFWARTKAGMLQAAELREIHDRCSAARDFPMISSAFPRASFRLNAFSYVSFPSPAHYRPGLNWRGLFRNLEDMPLYSVNAENRGFIPSSRVESLRSRPLGDYGRGAFSVNFDASACLDAFFEEFLALAGRNGIRVVYVLAPFSERTLRSLGPSYQKGFLAYLEAKKARFPHFAVGGGFSSVPDSLLADADHLNPAGAEAYTARLRKELAPWLAAAR